MAENRLITPSLPDAQNINMREKGHMKIDTENSSMREANVLKHSKTLFKECTRRKAENCKNFTLVEAVEKCVLSLVEVLIHQEDVNQQDKDGNTPLHLAARQVCKHHLHSPYCLQLAKPCDVVAIMLCLAGVADVSIINQAGRQPIHMLLDTEKCFYCEYTEHFAYCCKISIKLVECLITREFIDYKSPNGHTILTACLKNFFDFELLQLLLKKGADVTFRCSHKNRLPLHLLANRFFDEWATSLVAAFSTGGMLNAQDEDGNTALHLAIQANNIKVYKELLSHHADKNIRNFKQQLPLEVYLADTDFYGLREVDIELVLHLLADDQAIGMDHFLLLLYRLILTPQFATTQLKPVLRTILERMPRAAWSNLIDLHLTSSDLVETNVVIQIDNVIADDFELTQAEVFSRLLCELPVRFQPAPDALTLSAHLLSPQQARLLANINQLWKNYRAQQRLLPSLSQICRQTIWSALEPVRGYKIDALNLPHCIKQFIRQTEVADCMYDILMEFNVQHIIRENPRIVGIYEVDEGLSPSWARNNVFQSWADEQKEKEQTMH